MNKITSIVIHPNLAKPATHISVDISRGENRRIYTSIRSVDRLLAILNSDRYERKIARGKVSGALVINVTRKPKQEYFKITSVHREDLSNMGFTTDVDDNTMQELAELMGESYTELGVFWSDLKDSAEKLGIDRPKPSTVWDEW